MHGEDAGAWPSNRWLAVRRTNTIRHVAANVAGAVEPVAGVIGVEWVLQELLFGGIVQAQIARSHVWRSHVQLAHLPDAAESHLYGGWREKL